MATIAENIQTLRSIKSDIKNAIIQKGGSVTDAFGTYAQAITNLPSGGGGGTEIEDALITRTLSEYSNDRVSVVGVGTFAYYSNLTSVSFPNCTRVNAYAFYSCVKLTSINLQNCTFIDSNTFAVCDSLISIDLPKCSMISNNAFEDCYSLTYISLPLCEHIGNEAFGYCSNLISVSFPNCSYVSMIAFKFCISLTSINLQNCLFIGKQAFYNCNNLTQVYLNSVTRVTNMERNAFSNCPKLTSVYVPASLVDAFKTAQYWSSISNKIVAYTGEQVSTEDML